eukprot:TRINITY_DN11483_c0_g1_i1.p1 TRINITY_DN11483_c0_g1~~TRINITY_DN11483_c0_g1_i1.p1  ORF type:complete len:113 (-),score=19.82 TRINITY_DN11483_c0_g1_i1:385-723(-)
MLARSRVRGASVESRERVVINDAQQQQQQRSAQQQRCLTGQDSHRVGGGSAKKVSMGVRMRKLGSSALSHLHLQVVEHRCKCFQAFTLCSETEPRQRHGGGAVQLSASGDIQ